jgi:hypothetical protein
MNVGSAWPDAKGSRPPTPVRHGGGGVVLGARESRVQGEGRQGRRVLPVGSMRSPWNGKGRGGRTRPKVTISEVTLSEESDDLESPLRSKLHGGFGEGREETYREL